MSYPNPIIQMMLNICIIPERVIIRVAYTWEDVERNLDEVKLVNRLCIICPKSIDKPVLQSNTSSRIQKTQF
jgi:hypothetical protein